jgi:iron complex transport system permease protein
MSQRQKHILILSTLFFFAAIVFSLGDLLLELIAAPNNISLQLILTKIRIPRLLMTCLVGGGLALCGATIQTLLGNPLAEPYTLGISGGAAIGASIGILFSLGIGITNALGLGTAFITLLILLYLSGRNNNTTLILGGVILSFFFSSTILLLFSLAAPVKLKQIMLWLMGDLNVLDPNSLWIIAIPVILFLIIGVASHRHLDLLCLGEDYAQQLGAPLKRLRVMIILGVGIITALSVTYCGVIGFVGLMIPHCLRYLGGQSHRYILPGCFVLGAGFLLLCDALAHTLASPLTIPIGVITGFVGGLFFVGILVLPVSMRRSNRIRRQSSNHLTKDQLPYQINLPKIPPMKEPILQCNNIHFSYNRKVILNKFSLKIKQGESLALLGPNGSGKTTLLKIMGGLLNPQEGVVLLNNTNVKNYSVPERARSIAMMSQLSPQVPNFLVKDIIQMGRYPHKGPFEKLSKKDHEAIAYFVHKFYLEDLAEEALPKLSGGEQQRVWLAQALVQEPKILLLDEPFSSMDAMQQENALQILRSVHKSSQTAIVLVVHDHCLAKSFCESFLNL